MNVSMYIYAHIYTHMYTQTHVFQEEVELFASGSSQSDTINVLKIHLNLKKLRCLKNFQGTGSPSNLD